VDLPNPDEALQNPQTLGHHIKRRRRELCLRQRDVAAILGANRQTVAG